MTRYRCGRLPLNLLAILSLPLAGVALVCIAGANVAWASEVLPQTPAVSATADVVIVDADIRTMNADQPTASAIAIVGQRIAHVGNRQSVQAWIGNDTQLIDAGGRLIVPGFNDSHVHFLSGGQQLSSVQLRDAATPQQFVDRLKAFADQLPVGQWIVGGDWDHENWTDAPLPMRDWIDPFTADRGVLISRLDGHMALANTFALELAGINDQTPDPPGGEIVRDPRTGRATGMLRDSAMNLVSKNIPALTWQQRVDFIRAASDHAASLGVTSVQDQSGYPYDLVYRHLLSQGQLKTRVYAMAALPRWQELADQQLTAATGDAWIRRGGLKGFADGSLGSTTALFFDPYSDDPRTVGLPADEMFPEGAMLARIRGADAAGLQVMVHAIGDAANDQVLTMFQSVAAENGPSNRRFRIEHAQHIRPADIGRFASGQVIASMQPYHCADDGRWTEKRIGAERLPGTYAFRSLLDAGAVLAFGSDWNVAPLDPIVAIKAAVTRQTLDGKHPDGWIPQEKISVHDAVYAYTVGSAFAEYAETDKGMLTPGMLADLVMLSENLFADGFDAWDQTHAVLTMVDGKTVFTSAPVDSEQ